MGGSRVYGNEPATSTKGGYQRLEKDSATWSWSHSRFASRVFLNKLETDKQNGYINTLSRTKENIPPLLDPCVQMPSTTLQSMRKITTSFLSMRRDVIPAWRETSLSLLCASLGVTQACSSFCPVVRADNSKY